MWYVIVVVIIIILFSLKKKVKEDSGEILDVGLYFMDLQKEASINKSSYVLEQFYYILGCACQGRVDELKTIVKETNDDDELYDLIQEFKPRIMKMAKIAKEVTGAGISNDMKEEETLGQYESRKLMKRNAFATEFNYFKNLDINNHLKKL